MSGTWRSVDEIAAILNHPGHSPQKVHGGGGNLDDNIEADQWGNVREDGMWFDADGIHMTDSYVEEYGLPVSHSGFGDDASGRYSVVLSEGGDIHVMREADGGPDGAIYTRESGDVRIKGMDATGARDLADAVEYTMDATTVGRRTDDAGEDISGDDFGVGESRTSAGVTLTSAPNGAVVVSGLGKGGKNLKLDEGDAGQFSASLRAMADLADEVGGVT